MIIVNPITVGACALGIACLFKPSLLLYLFSSLPIIRFIPNSLEGSDKFKMMAIGSINVYVNDYLIIIFSLLGLRFLFRAVIQKKSILAAFAAGNISKAIIALFMWSAFISVLSYIKGFELQNIARELSTKTIMLIALVIPYLDIDQKERERFFSYSIFLGLAYVLIGLYRYGISHEIEYTSSGTIRTLLGNDVVVMLFPICYILFFGKRWQNNKLASFLLVGFLFAGICLTGHRSGIIVFLFVISLWYCVGKKFLADYFSIPLIALSLLLILLQTINSIKSSEQSFSKDAIHRIADTFDIENQTTQERLSKWTLAIKIAKDRPLLGLGRLPVYTSHFKGEGSNGLKRFSELDRATHNIFANKLIHEGLLGFAIMAGFFIIILRQFFIRSSVEKGLRYSLGVYCAAFILFSMFNTSFTNIESAFFFISLGIYNQELLKASYNE